MLVTRNAIEKNGFTAQGGVGYCRFFPSNQPFRESQSVFRVAGKRIMICKLPSTDLPCDLSRLECLSLKKKLSPFALCRKLLTNASRLTCGECLLLRAAA